MKVFRDSPATSPATSRKRLGWVDRLRGLAIVLMVLDHVLVQVDPASPIRLTVTRLALPLFMFSSALVWRGRPSNRRLLQLGLVVVLEAVLGAELGMLVPGIVGVFAVVVIALVLVPGIARNPLYGALGGLIQAIYLPIGWAGYEVGLVLAWWCIGRMAAESVSYRTAALRLPAWLEVVGRRPLEWYVGHLVVILGAVLVVG